MNDILIASALTHIEFGGRSWFTGRSRLVKWTSIKGCLFL